MDKNLLEIINELQEVIIKYKVKQQINLPEVLVIGSQSVGKSSLLELLINLQFLPKGEGIVTRCPLIIQVVRDIQLKQFEACFSHCPEKIFSTETGVQQEILNQTLKIAGNKKGISKDTIILKLKGPNFFTMSYVDLPGLTKIPTNDQPEDIEIQIRELCKSFALNPNSIILALSASNQDIVNSESLKFAMKIDPKGERTISVITKTDLFDGSNAYLDKLFKKNLINLQMGFVATSSIEFESNQQNIQKLKQKYQAFNEFNNFGRDILLMKLSKILRQKIKKTLPHVRQNLHELLSNLKAQQSSILIQKDLDNLDIKGKGILMLNFINKFVQDSTRHLQGESFEVGMTLQGAARINQIIDQNFRKEILAMNVLDVVKEEDIYIAVKNANGFKPSLFVSQKAFETLCKHMIQKLKPISLDCAESVSLELLQLFHNIQIQEIQLFKELQTQILTIVDDLIKQRLLPTKEFIEKFFEIETGFINTKHPDFLDSATQSINYQNEDEYQESEFMKKIPKREKNEIELIKKMLFNYFEVVKKNISDYIPKIILTLLVQKSIKDCETELIEKLYKPEQIEKLIKENEESLQKKHYLNEQISQIQKCLKNLNSFNQINFLQ